MEWLDTDQKWSAVFFTFACTCLVYSAYLGITHQRETSAIAATTQHRAQSETHEAATTLNTLISLLIPATQNLAHELEQSNLSAAQIEALLTEKPNELSGIGVAFAPYAFDNSRKLYAPYYVEVNGENQLIDVGTQYDYSEQDIPWFQRPLAQGAQFTTPYHGVAAKTVITEYAVPFYSPGTSEKGGPSGIVYANQSIEHLNHILSTLYSGSTGYWFIISQDGVILAHPDKTLAKNQITMFDISEKQGDITLAQATQNAMAGQSVITHYNNELTGAPSTLFCEPIAVTGWSLCRVFDQNELPFEKDTIRRSLMRVVLALAASLILFLFCFLCISGREVSILWTSVALTTLILSGTLYTLWYIVDTYPHYTQGITPIHNKRFLHSLAQQYEPDRQSMPSNNAPDTDETDSAETISARLRELTSYFRNSAHVPTGIFVSDLQIVNPSQVSFVGYIWQHYLDGTHDTTSRGFILPQATNVRSNEIYRKKESYGETIVWEVQATLNQQFSYLRYPFDVKDIIIEIWHKDFNKNTLLIPDLDSYSILNPRSKPGISAQARLEGWEITHSMFGYHTNYPRTMFGMYTQGAFGIYRHVDKSQKPDLSFIIRAERHLSATLLADLLPLCVIALLLFVILITSAAEGYGVIATCASIFFGTIYAQVRFRNNIPPYAVVYFESFFFVMYTAILLVVAFTTLYQLQFKIGFIQYRKNLMAKLLYWPVILTVLIAITTYFLY